MFTYLYREGQRRQSQAGQTFENYELRPRDGRMLQEDPAAAREGSAYMTNHGNTSTLASRTKSTDTRSVSQQLSRSPDSRDLPERPIQAQSSRLSALARSFVDLGLGNYLECSHFIANNPKILTQSENEALMAEASIAERAGQSTKAQICIHQALLLRKCNEVGLKNNSSFFRELNAKDSRTRESFVMDVKKVYGSIQKQIGRASEQRQGPNPEPQSRKSAVIVQSIEGTVSQNSYGYTQNSEENIQYREEVGLGRDGKAYHKDVQGNLSLPANSRHDPERHRSRSDPAQLNGSAQGAPGEASLANSQGRHVAGRFKRSPASDQAGSLPTLPEHFKYESTRIGGTAGRVEKLDDREYL
jgi:Cdc37 Hsp90 binding domain